jgi:hypothetical protein
LYQAKSCARRSLLFAPPSRAVEAPKFEHVLFFHSFKALAIALLLLRLGGGRGATSEAGHQQAHTTAAERSSCCRGSSRPSLRSWIRQQTTLPLRLNFTVTFMYDKETI